MPPVRHIRHRWYGERSTPPGFTSKIEFIVENIPAGGYKTFYVESHKTR